MRKCTGLELGPDSCAMVAAGAAADGAEVAAFHVVEAHEWPAHDVAVTSTLRSARREKKFPRRAAVVLWGLPDEARSEDPSTRAMVRPITAAGFQVDSVLSPPQALALVAAGRPRPVAGSATAWVALNTFGVAIAVVRDNVLLFARTFDWTYQPDTSSPKAQLLQRYTLVSHLAPELQRGMSQVRAEHGVQVDTVVTCGDLPELRSLTMPLIEELGIEVETLDSTDGMRPTGPAAADRFTELAASLRLATAAAVDTAARKRTGTPAWLRTAAIVGALAAGAWLAYTMWPRQTPPASQPSPLPRQPVVSRPATVPESAPVVAQPGAAGAGSLPQAPVSPPPPPGAQQAGAPVTRPNVSAGSQAATSGVRPPRAAAPPAAASLPQSAPAKPQAAGVLPLKDPLPRVDSILIDHNRRLAVVDGVTVRVGDAVGPRVVADIQQEAIVLREPSGLQVRVRLKR